MTHEHVVRRIGFFRMFWTEDEIRNFNQHGYALHNHKIGTRRNDSCQCIAELIILPECSFRHDLNRPGHESRHISVNPGSFTACQTPIFHQIFHQIFQQLIDFFGVR